LVRAEVAIPDPAAGRYRFRGWLRSASGRIFGVTSYGGLSWIQEDNTEDLAVIDWGKVPTVSDEQLVSVLAHRPHRNLLFWVPQAGGSVYLVGDGQMLHHVPTIETFRALFRWEQVVPVVPEQIAHLNVGPALQAIG
jgi:hypothetical protein